MKKLYFLDDEEKNRILNLHESATKKQYLSEQTLSVDEQIAKQFYDTGALGGGTNPDEMFNAINKITSAAQFWKVNELVKNRPKNSSKLDIAGVINDEFEYYGEDTGESNKEDIDKIIAKLAKIGITSTIKKNTTGTGSYQEKTFKITSQPVVPKTAAELDAAWATTYKCVTTQPGAKPSKLKDGSTSYVINGYVYYSNGFKRKMPAASNKSEKYTCAEFESNKSVVDPNKGNKSSSAAAIAPNIQAVQKQLGIQNATGTLDVATLQAMLAKLGGGITTAAPQQTVSSVAPAGIVPAGSPASAQLAQLGQTPVQMQQMLNNLTNRPQ